MKMIPPHGGDTISWRECHPRRRVLDFSANIAPLGLPESAGEALRGCAGGAAAYPDPYCRELRRAIGVFEGVDPAHILCGNGAADLIYRIAYALRPPRGLLTAPAFSEYEAALTQAGCEIAFYPLVAENRFAVQRDILSKIPTGGCVFLCNPNNPTGQLTEPDLLEAVLEACGHAGAVLVVDECFLDFLGDGDRYSMKRFLPSRNHLLILRAFTKIFAMPGLRLGYLLCGDASLLKRIGRAGPPWSVSVPAQACGIAAAGETAYLDRVRALIHPERRRMEATLAGFGLIVYPASANYVFFSTNHTGLGARLEERGILLRDCGNFRGLQAGYYRAAVRTQHENNALLQAVKELILCKTSC